MSFTWCQKHKEKRKLSFLKRNTNTLMRKICKISSYQRIRRQGQVRLKSTCNRRRKHWKKVKREGTRVNPWGVREAREEHEDSEKVKGRERRQHKGQYGLNAAACVEASIVAASATAVASSQVIFCFLFWRKLFFSMSPKKNPSFRKETLKRCYLNNN